MTLAYGIYSFFFSSRTNVESPEQLFPVMNLCPSLYQMTTQFCKPLRSWCPRQYLLKKSKNNILKYMADQVCKERVCLKVDLVPTGAASTPAHSPHLQSCHHHAPHVASWWFSSGNVSNSEVLTIYAKAPPQFSQSKLKLLTQIPMGRAVPTVQAPSIHPLGFSKLYSLIKMLYNFIVTLKQLGCS